MSYILAHLFNLFPLVNFTFLLDINQFAQSGIRIVQNLKSLQRRNYPNIDGLIQERHNSIANALELCISCTNQSICGTELDIISSMIKGMLPVLSQTIIWTWLLINRTKQIFSRSSFENSVSGLSTILSRGQVNLILRQWPLHSKDECNDIQCLS